MRIKYRAEVRDQSSERLIEPFAFYYRMQQHWTQLPFARLDRMEAAIVTDFKFAPHQLSLQKYLQEKKKIISTDKLLSQAPITLQHH
ncbi:hypothetical protein QF042_002858 [Pedobacter sp. W3I1]|uniref:hypothetical protein n=1 Tax=Pedobacter sp. W3I1 TaxID=3042291 RepID=UPI00277F1969|nr:hypothetical protein [Pedobacter sp. W3I1]MDQ0639293.1 hypothetical protein [Pedobacter sp. W3I1]